MAFVSRLGITSAAVILSVSLLAVRYPKPTPLKDRLDVIADDAVEIDNDALYATFDWWNAYNPLAMANAARVPFFLRTLFHHLRHRKTLRDLTVLDVGCGGGLVTERLAEELDNVKVIGVDLSSASIEKAKNHSSLPEDRLAYIVGSAYALPFPDSSIDAVICSDVFEHLHDVVLAMKEIARVLRPGGRLVYDTINRTTFSWWVTIVIGQEWVRYVPGHAHDWRLYITPQEMTEAARRAGLQHDPLESLKGMRPTLAFPWTIVSRLLDGAGVWSLLDRWTICSLTQASYLSSCVKV